jgi:hypothetical protein
MDGNAFSGIYAAMVGLFWAAVVMFPLAVWKIIDIIIWLANHVSIS